MRTLRLSQGIVIAAAAAMSLALASSASAAVPSAKLVIQSVAQPTNFTSSDGCVNPEIGLGLGCDSYDLRITNAGSRATTGKITILDMLPPHLNARGVEATNLEALKKYSEAGFACTAVPVKCVYEDPMPPGDVLTVRVNVEVEAAFATSETVTNYATAGLEGTPPVATGEPATKANTVNAGQPPFGVQDFGLSVTDEAGNRDTQAGDHPYALTSTVDFNTYFTNEGTGHGGLYYAVQHVKALAVELPLGLVGNPLAAPQCPEIDVKPVQGGGGARRDARPLVAWERR
jgi:hypothetical protein